VRATDIEAESTVSPPHDVTSSSASHQAGNSCDTDQQTVTDQSQLTADNSSQSAVAADAVNDSLPAVSDSVSADKTDSLTGAENIEAHREGGSETACVSAVTAASETDDKEGSETASAQVVKATELVEKSPEAVVQVDDGGKSSVTDAVTSCALTAARSDEAVKSSVAMATSSSSGGAKSLPEMVDSDSLTDCDYLALSYLVHPPDGCSFDRPYLDEFWQCRWSRMETEIRRLMKKSSRLASDVITLGSSSSSEYDSSDCEYSDEYEDSLDDDASPILVQEMRPRDAEDDNDVADEIVLDENSSNAILVADDDEVDDDDIVCSGEINEDDKSNGGDTSVVICEGENSAIDDSNPACSTSTAAQPRPPDDIEPTDSMVEASDSCVGGVGVANGSVDTEAGEKKAGDKVVSCVDETDEGGLVNGSVSHCSTSTDHDSSACC